MVNGEIMITQPWPAMLQTIYGNPERFVKPISKMNRARVNYYISDLAHRDADGYF